MAASVTIAIRISAASVVLLRLPLEWFLQLDCGSVRRPKPWGSAGAGRTGEQSGIILLGAMPRLSVYLSPSQL
jgi:hypothetical protein